MCSGPGSALGCPRRGPDPDISGSARRGSRLNLLDLGVPQAGPRRFLKRQGRSVLTSLDLDSFFLKAGGTYIFEKSSWKNSITSSEIFLFNVLWSVLFPIYELLMVLRFSNDKSRSSFRKKSLFLSNQ